MLKAGDKLLCKKTTNYESMDKKYNINKERNKYYTITGVKDNYIVYFGVDYYSLNLNNSNYYIWNYFYTPQEIRKMKLKQLNDVESRW